MTTGNIFERKQEGTNLSSTLDSFDKRAKFQRGDILRIAEAVIDKYHIEKISGPELYSYEIDRARFPSISEKSKDWMEFLTIACANYLATYFYDDHLSDTYPDPVKEHNARTERWPELTTLFGNDARDLFKENRLSQNVIATLFQASARVVDLLEKESSLEGIGALQEAKLILGEGRKGGTLNLFKDYYRGLSMKERRAFGERITEYARSYLSIVGAKKLESPKEPLAEAA